MACGDDGESPVITITTPSDTPVFVAGDTLSIIGTATDDTGIESVNFTSATAGFELDGGDLDISGQPDKTNIILSVNLGLNTSTVAGDYTINVNATDEDGNVTTEPVDFTVQ